MMTKVEDGFDASWLSGLEACRPPDAAERTVDFEVDRISYVMSNKC